MKISHSEDGPKWTRCIKQGTDRVKRDMRMDRIGEGYVTKQQPGTNYKGC
jgi:hypothetical protein